MSYVKPDQILCKGCGVTVVKMDKVGAHPTSAYENLLIRFDDGSDHLTPLCKKCASGATVEDAKEYYKEDLNQWIDEAKMNKTTLPEQWYQRTPVSCEVQK